MAVIWIVTRIRICFELSVRSEMNCNSPGSAGQTQSLHNLREKHFSPGTKDMLSFHMKAAKIRQYQMNFNWMDVIKQVVITVDIPLWFCLFSDWKWRKISTPDLPLEILGDMTSHWSWEAVTLDFFENEWPQAMNSTRERERIIIDYFRGSCLCGMRSVKWILGQFFYHVCYFFGGFNWLLPTQCVEISMHLKHFLLRKQSTTCGLVLYPLGLLAVRYR